MQVSDWDAEDDEDIEEEKNPHSSPVKEILWAAEHNKIDILKKLLESNPSLTTSKDKDGYTPLHRACYNNHIDAVDLLLQYNADINSKTAMGWQPIHSACKWNNAKIAARLLQHGADVNARTSGNQTPLHMAASHSHCKEILQLLLMHPDIELDIENDSHETGRQVAFRSCKFYSLFDLTIPSINNIEK